MSGRVFEAVVRKGCRGMIVLRGVMGCWVGFIGRKLGIIKCGLRMFVLCAL